MDRTLVICKPDAVERGLIGEIIGRFEGKGLTRAELERYQGPSGKRAVSINVWRNVDGAQPIRSSTEV